MIYGLVMDGHMNRQSFSNNAEPTHPYFLKSVYRIPKG